MKYEAPMSEVDLWALAEGDVIGASQGGAIPLPEDTFPED